MQQISKIRVKVFGLIREKNRLFVSENYDNVKAEKFYRALGGSIEFGENSQTALKREFQEEVQADLTNIRYLGCLENFFSYNGKKGHEIVQVYECDFVDSNYYQLEKLAFFEADNSPCTAVWIDISRFQSGELRLVPDKFIDYL